MSKVNGIIYTGLSAILFGSTPVLAKMLMDLGCSSTMVVSFRSIFTVLLFGVFLVFRKVSFKITKKQFIYVILIGVLGQGLTTILLYSSYKWIPLGTATTVHFLYPFFVAGFLAIFFKNRFSKKENLCCLIALVGVLCFFEMPHGQQTWKGFLLAVISGVTYAFYLVGVDKTEVKSMDSMLLAWYFAIVVSIMTIIYTVFNHEFNIILPATGYFYAFVMAAGTSAFATMLLQKGIVSLGAGTAALLSLLEPITSFVVDIFYDNQVPSFKQILGCILIFSAILAFTNAKEKS